MARSKSRRKPVKKLANESICGRGDAFRSGAVRYDYVSDKKLRWRPEWLGWSDGYVDGWRKKLYVSVDGAWVVAGRKRAEIVDWRTRRILFAARRARAFYEPIKATPCDICEGADCEKACAANPGTRDGDKPASGARSPFSPRLLSSLAVAYISVVLGRRRWFFLPNSVSCAVIVRRQQPIHRRVHTTREKNNNEYDWKAYFVALKKSLIFLFTFPELSNYF